MYYTSGNFALKRDQISRVRESWAMIKPTQDRAAHLFYYHLFRHYPELRKLFSGNMKDQGDKLISVFDLVVEHLDELDSLKIHLNNAGKAHREFGVSLADYKKVKVSLLWTVEAILVNRTQKRPEMRGLKPTLVRDDRGRRIQRFQCGQKTV